MDRRNFIKSLGILSVLPFLPKCDSAETQPITSTILIDGKKDEKPNGVRLTINNRVIDLKGDSIHIVRYNTVRMWNTTFHNGQIDDLQIWGCVFDECDIYVGKKVRGGNISFNWFGGKLGRQHMPQFANGIGYYDNSN